MRDEIVARLEAAQKKPWRKNARQKDRTPLDLTKAKAHNEACRAGAVKRWAKDTRFADATKEAAERFLHPFRSALFREPE